MVEGLGRGQRELESSPKQGSHPIARFCLCLRVFRKRGEYRLADRKGCRSKKMPRGSARFRSDFQCGAMLKLCKSQWALATHTLPCRNGSKKRLKVRPNISGIRTCFESTLRLRSLCGEGARARFLGSWSPRLLVRGTHYLNISMLLAADSARLLRLLRITDPKALPLFVESPYSACRYDASAGSFTQLSPLFYVVLGVVRNLSFSRMKKDVLGTGRGSV